MIIVITQVLDDEEENAMASSVGMSNTERRLRVVLVLDIRVLYMRFQEWLAKTASESRVRVHQ